MEPDKKIATLLKDFYNISNIRVSIHDTTFKEIYSYPKELTPFCRFVQSLPKIYKQCLESDSLAFERVKNTNKPYIYRCKCGLYEAVAPIYNYGRLTGYLMMGQVIDDDRKILENTLKQLEKYNIDNAALKKSADKIVSLKLSKLNSFVQIMTVLAEHLTQTNKIKDDKETLAFLVYKEIIDNKNQDLTLASLSQKFGCSVATVTNLFKKEYGVSIHQFIINTRLERAKQLLRNSDKALKEIAYECGFYDQNHFYRTFKSIFKISPSDYRKTNR